MAAIAVRRKLRNQPSDPAPPKRGIELTAEDVERILLSFGREMRAGRRRTQRNLQHGLNRKVQK